MCVVNLIEMYNNLWQNNELICKWNFPKLILPGLLMPSL